jgi:hypothetical protein
MFVRMSNLKRDHHQENTVIESILNYVLWKGYKVGHRSRRSVFFGLYGDICHV